MTDLTREQVAEAVAEVRRELAKVIVGQEAVIRRAARALTPGGAFLMTAPTQTAEWVDVLTGARNVSLGADRYRALLADAGLVVEGEADDEGGNHYWQAVQVEGRKSRGEVDS